MAYPTNGHQIPFNRDGSAQYPFVTLVRINDSSPFKAKYGSNPKVKHFPMFMGAQFDQSKGTYSAPTFGSLFITFIKKDSEMEE